MALRYEDIEVCPECGVHAEKLRVGKIWAESRIPVLHWSNPCWTAFECRGCGCRWEVTFEPSQKIIRKHAATVNEEE